MTYFSNPFTDIVPGGSPSDQFSRPPGIVLGGVPYVVLFYWDAPIIQAKNSAHIWAEMKERGVTGQAKLKGADGTEYFARIIDYSKTELAMTGFRSSPLSDFELAFWRDVQPPTSKEIDMTILHKFHEHIASLYVDTPSVDTEAMCEDLATCTTLADTQLYLAWKPKDFQRELESFFSTEI